MGSRAGQFHSRSSLVAAPTQDHLAGCGQTGRPLPSPSRPEPLIRRLMLDEQLAALTVRGAAVLAAVFLC